MMTVQVIAFIAGSVFIFIAIIGGGITIQELKLPTVPKVGRIISGVVGVLFIFISLLMPLISNPPSGGRPPNPSPQGRDEVIHIDEAMATSSHGVKVLKITALSQNNPPQVNDRVTIQFSFQNVGREQITLNPIFIGARDPADNNVDFGHENYDKILAPDEVVDIKNSIIVTEQGVWEFWPCYIIGNDYCPDEWRAFQISVVAR